MCTHLPNPNGAAVVDCEAIGTLPDVTFTIGGNKFVLTAEQVSLFSHLIDDGMICHPSLLIAIYLVAVCFASFTRR